MEMCRSIQEKTPDVGQSFQDYQGSSKRTFISP